MKTKLFFALSLFSLTLVARPQSMPQMPSMLNCRATTCIYGHAGFCEPGEFQKIVLNKLQTENPEWDNQAGTRYAEAGDDKVTLDFSDGDQYSRFVFRKDDIEEFVEGRKQTVPGTYEDGYDWADGYHTRAFLALSCTR
jgi:hypothetical protein